MTEQEPNGKRSDDQRSSHTQERSVQSSHGDRDIIPERATAPGADAGVDVRAGHDEHADRSSDDEREGRSEYADQRGEVAARTVDPRPVEHEPDPLEVAIEAVPEEHRGVILGALAFSQDVSWSGALPMPDQFYQYHDADRERMMRWNDAGTADESARQDRLVNAQIQQAERGPRRAITIVTLCLALAAVSGWVFDNTILAGLFLSAPILMFAQQLLATLPTRGKSGERSGDKQG